MKYSPIIFFLAIALAVMAPLYAPGFVFLLDMVWGPQIEVSDALRRGVTPGLPLAAGLSLLAALVPAEIIQKIILTLVLWLPGVTMYTLARRAMDRKWAVSAGILFQLNPYVYERFVAGQWLVLLGYGLLPLVVWLLLRALDDQGWRQWIIFSVAFAVYPLCSLHWSYVAGGVLVLLGLMWALNKAPSHREGVWGRGKNTVLSTDWGKKVVAFLGIFLLINAFWLLSFFTPSGTYAAIGDADFKAFATQADPQWGLLLNVLSLYGFWRSEHLLPKEMITWWWIPASLVIILTLVGAYRVIARRQPLGMALVISFVPAVILAMGYGSAVTTPVVRALAAVVPLLSGLRDTAKVIGLLAFAYALLAPLGLQTVYAAAAQRYRQLQGAEGVVAGVFTFIIFLSMSSLLWGASGQLQAYAYPAGWHRAQDALVTDAQFKTALVLPWRAYLRLDFAESVQVANPARAFFTVPVVASDNTENAFLLAAERSQWNRTITALVHGMSTVSEQREFFREEGVTHIVLLKTDDWDRYLAMLIDDAVELVFEDESVEVYRVMQLE